MTSVRWNPVSKVLGCGPRECASQNLWNNSNSSCKNAVPQTMDSESTAPIIWFHFTPLKRGLVILKSWVTT